MTEIIFGDAHDDSQNLVDIKSKGGKSKIKMGSTHDRAIQKVNIEDLASNEPENPKSSFTQSQIEELAQDCANYLTKSYAQLALMKLSIPPAKIVDHNASLQYYINLIQYTLAIGQLKEWLEQLTEYKFAERWLQILNNRS